LALIERGIGAFDELVCALLLGDVIHDRRLLGRLLLAEVTALPHR